MSFQIAVYQDTKWDQLQKLPDTATCRQKRDLATTVAGIKVTMDGQWYSDLPEIKLYSNDRPHLYYTAQLDCEHNFEK